MGQAKRGDRVLSLGDFDPTLNAPVFVKASPFRISPCDGAPPLERASTAGYRRLVWRRLVTLLIFLFRSASTASENSLLHVINFPEPCVADFAGCNITAFLEFS